MARLWSYGANTTCHELIIDRSSAFRHRVGGPSSVSGTIPSQGPAPIHHVMTLDLADSRVPFAQPGLRELPLFHPFQYDGSNLSYRVLNDTSIEIVKQPARGFSESFPYESYPSVFPLFSIALSDRIEISKYFLDPFLKKQGKSELKQAKSEGRILEDIDRIALIEGLMQGPPNTNCTNPACDKEPMKLITVLHGDLIPGVHFWSNDEYGPEVDVTFEYCPKCFTIHTQNQCG